MTATPATGGFFQRPGLIGDVSWFMEPASTYCGISDRHRPLTGDASMTSRRADPWLNRTQQLRAKTLAAHQVNDVLLSGLPGILSDDRGERTPHQYQDGLE